MHGATTKMLLLGLKQRMCLEINNPQCVHGKFYCVIDLYISAAHVDLSENRMKTRKGQTHVNLVASGNRKVLNDERFHTALRSWPSISGKFAR
jgi:hypothetical protein